MAEHGPQGIQRANAAGPAVVIAVAVVLAAVAAGFFLAVKNRERTLDTARTAVEKADRQRESLRDVSADWTLARQVATIDTGFDEPRGIGVGPEGVLYVAGDRAVRALESDGALRGGFAVEGEPRCIAIGDDGAVWVGVSGYVAAYSSNGERMHRWQPYGSRSYVTCISLSAESVWVADAGERALLHYDRTGNLLGAIGGGEGASGSVQFRIPSPHFDVVTLDSGEILVNNPGKHQVQTLTADGEVVASWGEYSAGVEGFCGCCNPTDIAVMPDGRIVTSEKGLPRVKVYTEEGELHCVVAAPEDLSRNAQNLDIAVGPRGRIIVLDPPARAIRLFELSESTANNHTTSRSMTESGQG